MNLPSRPGQAGGPPDVQPAALRPRQSVPIYFYIYDDSLSEPKHANALARIEARLTDLELQGRVGRLGPLKSAKEMVKSAIKAGATTIVAVGNDRTVIETINALAETKATLGIIPTGKPSTLAHLLGIPEGEAACEVLAARKIETVDLGRAGPYYFLSEAEIQAKKALVECDGSFTLEGVEGEGRSVLANLVPGSQCQDGRLEVILEPPRQTSWFRRETRRPSIIPFQRATIAAEGNDEAALLIEGTFTAKLPLTIEVVPRGLKIIVGRDRVF